MTGAVPGPVGFIPADDEAHVAAYCGNGMDLSVFVLEGRDIVDVDFHDCSLSGGPVIEGSGFARQIAADKVGGDRAIAFHDVHGAGNWPHRVGSEHEWKTEKGEV